MGDLLDSIKEPYERIRATAQQQQDLVEKAIETDKPVFYGTWMPTGEKFYIVSASTMTKQPYAHDVTTFVRPEVMRFAGIMETKLRLKEHKDHWSGETKQYLFGRLLEEVTELFGELPDGELINECVDVANFAMMLADNHGGNAWKS